MKYIVNIDNKQYEVADILEFRDMLLKFDLFVDSIDCTIINYQLFNRYFIYKDSNVVFISDKLSVINSSYSLNVNDDAIVFYRKYGFILPPFTQYNGVYIISPYKKIAFSKSLVLDGLIYPEKKNESIDFESYISNNFSEGSKYNILVSGGIDSSALLGVLSAKSSIEHAFMIKMSSLPDENNIARKMCLEKEVDFNLISLDKDLSDLAVALILESGELISDNIAIPISELFRQISLKSNLPVVDGQGADSLLNGLPLNKILDLWLKMKPIRLFLAPLRYLKVYNKKGSRFERKLYRISKALIAISQKSFPDVINAVLVEDNSIDVGTYERYLIERMHKLYEEFHDWHFVIKYLYMFDVLHSREMQKYITIKKCNLAIKAPFLESKTIEDLFYLSNDSLIKNGTYKYPITVLAKKYWPGYFKSSATSPFQVNYTISQKDIKEFSINLLRLK